MTPCLTGVCPRERKSWLVLGWVVMNCTFFSYSIGFVSVGRPSTDTAQSEASVCVWVVWVVLCGLFG